MTLSDTQSALLGNAARRESGSLLPLPDSLAPGGGTSKALLALVRKGFAEERATTIPAAANRSDGDARYGLFITPAGTAAIGLAADQAESPAASAAAPMVPPATSTKVATVISLLERTSGATLPELTSATGWLPHSTRAALTGLRNKGYEITRGKRDGVTCYSIGGRA